jgi:membrane-associated protease RseP (regulator of RpoE activity)
MAELGGRALPGRRNADTAAAAPARKAGLGLVLQLRAGERPAVERVSPGGPAERSGVRAGDRLLAVDGQDVAGLSLRDVAVLIAGPAGSMVQLRLERRAPARGGEASMVRGYTVLLIRSTETAPLRKSSLSPPSGSQRADFEVSGVHARAHARTLMHALVGKRGCTRAHATSLNADWAKDVLRRG